MFGFFFSTSLSTKIFSFLKQVSQNYDILHIHLPDPMIVFALYFINPKQKIIIHWHSDIVKQKFLKTFFNIFQNWILKRSDIIICTSQKYLDHSHDLKSFKEKAKIRKLNIRKK